MIHIKDSFSKFLVYLVLPAIIAISVVMVFRVRTIQMESLSDLVHHHANRASEQFSRFLTPVATNLMMIRQWGQSAVLDHANADALANRLMAVTDTHLPQVSGLMIANTDGYEFKLLRKKEGWSTHITAATEPKHLPSGSYDPRQRPWFNGALAEPEPQVHWTGVYPFFSKKVPGITAAVRYRVAENDSITWVVAADIVLEEIKHFIRELSLDGAGNVLLVGNEKVADLSSVLKSASPKTTNSYATAFDGDLQSAAGFSQAVALWKESGSKNFSPSQIKLNGRQWWAVFFPLSAEHRYTHVGILLPEKELLSDARRRGYIQLLRSLFILVVIALVMIFIAVKRSVRKQGDRDGQSVSLTDSEDKFISLIESGERGRLEFKSTMRWNLKSGKAAKEIELAALKTVVAFLNSEGGTLLIGVDDGGDILGVAADNFANEDKYLLHFNNLVKQHIGLEYSRFISFFLKPLAGKKIMVVVCRPAEQPVFLKHKNEEDFYVRVGPGSRKLPTKQALDYIKNRKNRG
jgi:schlafen family protein